MLVSGLVVFFSMVHGRRAVRVRRKLVELGSSLVRITWHGALSSMSGHSRNEWAFHPANQNCVS